MGTMKKKGENDYRLKIKDDRGEFHTSRFIAKNEIIFSTTRGIVSEIQNFTKSGEAYPVKLYCDMYLTHEGGPWAEVYKIEFLSVLGRPAYTARE